MPITAEAIDRLKAQLLTSGLSQQNQALFQVINQLIGAVRQSLANTEAITGGGGGGGGGVTGATFITGTDETASLPNSRQIYPGAGINIQSTPNGRIVIHSAVPWGMDSGGEGEDGPPGPPGRDGIAGAPGPAGANAVSFLYAFDGIDGEDAPIIPGPAGIQGIQGQTGGQGIPGIPGLDGEDGLDSMLPGPTGLQGIQGIQGIQGPIGPQGIQGYDPDEPNEPMMIPGPPGATGGILNLMKTTGNQTINSGAGTFVDITGLTFPVVNGQNYAFTFYIAFQSANVNTGWKASVNHPGGTVDHFTTYQTVANAAAGVSTWLHKHNTAVDDMTLLTSTITAAVDLVVIIQGRYKCTANGTFAARFANELAANTDIVVQQGSWGMSF